MERQFIRTAKLIGEEGINKLNQSTVAVFGLGGVGGYAVEALARVGIGHLILIDFDRVDVSNINRQIVALHSTLGELKTELLKTRVLDINPQIEVVLFNMTYSKIENQCFDHYNIDFAIDAIDMVSSKLDLIEYCYHRQIPVISSMGTANKLRPEALMITTIEKTSHCGLARVMRKELKNRGLTHVPVVFSTEEPIEAIQYEEDKDSVKRSVAGSTSFVPPAAGFLLGSYVVRRLLNHGDGIIAK